MGLRDFRIGWRLLARQPFQSAVELLGLATGFAVCFLLLGFVHYSFSYDRDVPERERVYLIKHRVNFIPQPQWLEYTPFPLREVALRSGLPLEASVWWPRKTAARLDGRLRELELVAVDPAFERIAGLSAARGDLARALTLPDGLAVTRQTALRLFGTTEALGRTVEIDRQTLQVRAVLADRPANSTLQFGALVGIGSALWPEAERRQALSNWLGIAGRIYVKTGPGVTAQALQKALQGVIDQSPWGFMATPEMTAALAGRKMVDVELGPLADAYFDRSVANTMGTGPRGDRRVVLAMGAAGLLILALAVVNYVNLATVRTLRRQREIAMRRVLGATTARLLAQFMAESVLLSVAAAALGMLLAWLLLPLSSELLDRRLDGVFTPSSVAACLLFGALVGALAGLYPGWLARGLDMGAALAHRSGETTGGAWVRRALTALQFATAMATGSVALAILWQTQFAGGVPPGFDPAPLLVVELDTNVNEPAARALRDALARLPGVAGVADSSNVPGRDDGTGTRGSTVVNSKDGAVVSLPVQWVGTSFFDVYRISPLAGRLFDPRIDGAQGQGESAVVVNQAAVRALGWRSDQEALGQRIEGTESRIVGVVPEVRWDSLREPVRPLMYLQSNSSRLLTVRAVDAAPGARLALEQAIVATAQRYFPARAPSVRRAGDYYAQAYKEDLRIAGMLACATAVVFALAAFGIYVLAATSVQRRGREIVLRKLHGAGRVAIGALVGREFLALTAAAAAIGLPPAVLGIERYLAPFADRTPLGAWAPAAALAAALLVAAAATARHTLAAMRIAPARALRD
nr:ABC transporter permease [uncultured Duganella sp.]